MKRMWRRWGRREHWVPLNTSPIEMFAFLPQNGTKLGVLHLLPLPGSVTITGGSPSSASAPFLPAGFGPKLSH